MSFSFKNNLIFRASLLTFFLYCFLAVNGQNGTERNVVAPVKISSEIDTTTITMGERTTVHVEVLKNGHVGTVLLPFDKTSGENEVKTIGGIEIRRIEVDSTDLGNNRIQVRYDLLIQPFEPVDIVIPPFKYALDKDTFTSNVIALKVLEPEIPKEMRDSLYINPLRPPMSIQAEWYDWVPDWFTDYWYFWLSGLLLVALAVVILILYKKNGKSIFTTRKIVPPYELATHRLNELKRKRLHEQGHNKAYYTELTDILRQYLGGRFKIYALEMTSSQILDEMRANPDTAPYVELLKPMFNIADFVKFAKQQSTTDENIRSFKAVEEFVEDTKPVPEASGNNGSDNKGK